MDQFIAKHADAIEGTLSCFDRLIFRGSLPFFSGYAMAAFLEANQVHRWDLKRFLIEQAEPLKAQARRMAEAAGRPFESLREASDTDDLARTLAERDGIPHGLICVDSAGEPCRPCSLRWQQRHSVQSAKRTGLFLSDSFMDPDLGLIPGKLQPWFPLQLQLSVNGHEWLARTLTRHGIRYTKLDNAFLWIEDFPRAQPFADRFVTVGWVALLQRDARRVNPLLGDLLHPMQDSWVTAQAESSTDLVFKSRSQLRDLVPRLLEPSTRSFTAQDVLAFLGRKLHGKFEGEGLTDLRAQELKG